MMRRATILSLGTVLLLSLQACSFRYGDTFKAQTVLSRSVDHVGGSPLVVRTKNGRVDVVASPDRSDVSIEASLRCGGKTQAEADERLTAASLSVSRSADRTLVVKPIFPEPRVAGDGASITVALPDADGVEVDTSNGSVTVRGLTGLLVIDTSNGSVDVADHQGDARIDTSNGAISVSDHVGTLLVDTSNGSIRLDDVDGPVTADTSNGSIVLSLASKQSGPLRLDTSNASIKVRVGAGFAGSVSFNTSNGSIAVEDHLGRVTSRSMGKRSGRIVVGEGGSASRLDTSNGRIVFTVEG
ncbi:MAG: DUF4097 family beta strand repeat-containing protein [Planctomycetota bacterium]|jgi:hypothetical protein